MTLNLLKIKIIKKNKNIYFPLLWLSIFQQKAENKNIKKAQKS